MCPTPSQDGTIARPHHVCSFCRSSDETTWYDDAYYWEVPPSEQSANEDRTMSVYTTGLDSQKQ